MPGWLLRDHHGLPEPCEKSEQPATSNLRGREKGSPWDSEDVALEEYYSGIVHIFLDMERRINLANTRSTPIVFTRLVV